MGRRQKKPEKEPNLERWLVSYADFITLLFAVFVTLYAMSQTDKKKVEQVVESIRESFGFVSGMTASQKPGVIDSIGMGLIPSIRPGLTPAPGKTPSPQGGKKKTHAKEVDFKAIKISIEAFLANQGARQKVEVGITRRGLVISLKEGGFFDSGNAEVRKSSYPILARLAESLANYSNAIRVEGHTDNMPISSHVYRSNWELSTARATNIVHYMADYYDFDPARMSATGYGEFRPVAGNDSEEGRSRNRRVDIVLLSGESEAAEP